MNKNTSKFTKVKKVAAKLIWGQETNKQKDYKCKVQYARSVVHSGST